MVKKTITIAVDVEVYLQIQKQKAEGKEINISEICNGVLKTVVDIDMNTKISDLDEAEEESKILMSKINSLKSEYMVQQNNLNDLRNKRDKEIKARMKKQVDYTKGKRDGGVMDFE